MVTKAPACRGVFGVAEALARSAWPLELSLVTGVARRWGLRSCAEHGRAGSPNPPAAPVEARGDWLGGCSEGRITVSGRRAAAPIARPRPASSEAKSVLQRAFPHEPPVAPPAPSAEELRSPCAPETAGRGKAQAGQ